MKYLIRILKILFYQVVAIIAIPIIFIFVFTWHLSLKKAIVLPAYIWFSLLGNRKKADHYYKNIDENFPDQ